jgi:flagellar hook-associated protein 1 FlgK
MIRGTFLGLEIAKKGVLAARGALDTVSHNIANANTEGYTRQRVDLKASFPLTFPGIGVTLKPGTIGTGVEIKSITRIRDEFIESQLLKEGSTLGRYEVVDDGLRRIENIFADPSDYGFNQLLSEFFDAWEDMSNSPESLSARTNLVEVTRSLTGFVNEAARKLDLEVKNINDQLETKITEVNSLAREIASLNEQIIQIETGGGNQNANDLKDSRDQLVREMSKMINVRTEDTPDGGVSVYLMGHPIVQDGFFDQLELGMSETETERPMLRFTKSKVAAPLTDGELLGLVNLRDQYIPAFRDEFGTLVTTLANRINMMHLEGFGLDGNSNRPFFNDFGTWKLDGLKPLASGTTLDTTLDELGVVYGDFFLEGVRVEVSPEEVRPGTALTLGELLDRMNSATPDLRFSLDTTLGFPRIVVEKMNPVSADERINIKDGTCNFFELAGLDPDQQQQLLGSAEYGGSLKAFGLSPSILSSLQAIAAAADDGSGQMGGPGDNRTALAIADLKNEKDGFLKATFSEYYQGLISILGADGAVMVSSRQAQQQVLDEVKARRESVSGVSLDEEAVNLIRYQKAFTASARAITTIDDILDVIVNLVGAAGG